MKKSFFLLILLLTLSISELRSQTLIIRNPKIETELTNVDVKSLERSVIELSSIRTRHNLSTQQKNKGGIGDAYIYLEHRLREINKDALNKANIDIIPFKTGGEDTRLGRSIILKNIVATFKGKDSTSKKEILLLAHFDSRNYDNSDSTINAPGANDNGSGVAALLEIAKVLSNSITSLTVKLLFLSGEEHGLLGAVEMAQAYKSEGKEIIAVINNDMIGNTLSSETFQKNNNIVRVFSENSPAFESESSLKIKIFNSIENDSQSRQVARYIKEIGERYVENILIKLIYRSDRFGRGGDHTPFNKVGFPSVRICEYYENYDNTHHDSDIASNVDLEYLKKNCSINLAVVLSLANAPLSPINAKIDITNLGNYSKLSWEAPKTGKKPAYYYVLIRESDESMWSKKIKVKEDSITLPISRDNYIYAIQSVDLEGNESIPTIALASQK